MNATTTDIELILVDPNEAVCSAWRSAFAKCPEVSIVCGRFEALQEFDCVVSAAGRQAVIGRGGDLMAAADSRDGAR